MVPVKAKYQMIGVTTAIMQDPHRINQVQVKKYVTQEEH